MKYILSCIGKMKQGPQQELLALYKTRLKTPLIIHEFEAKASLPTLKRQEVEADLLLSIFQEHTFLIALDETGKEFTSQSFAHKIQDIKNQGYKAVGFIIGGADGLHPLIKERADLFLCLGRLTWPHMLVRGLLAEQLYRGESILAGHPYHRE